MKEEEEEDLFMDFEKFWPLLANRGRVAHLYKDECECLWRNFTPQRQQAIYDNIERKINAGLFIHYNPVNAIKDNVPPETKLKIISYQEYVKRYHTDLEQDGWVRKHLPEQQKTIFIKQI